MVSGGAALWASGIEDGDSNLAKALAVQQQLIGVPFHEEAAVVGVPSTAPPSEEACVLWAWINPPSCASHVT